MLSSMVALKASASTVSFSFSSSSTTSSTSISSSATSCHTCNIFVNNQSFKSNLTGKEYKTISYDRLSCGSTNVIYGIHCVHCGLVYVGETGRSLRSRMNGHRSAIKKEDKAYSTDTFINQIILWMT